MSKLQPLNIKGRKAIRNHLQEQIVQGKYSPGERMPNRNILEKQFGVSSVTLQGAMSGLIEDGFIRAVPKQGTFVSSFPPHLCQYGLLFGMKNPQTHTMPASHFYQRLYGTANHIQQEREDVRFRIYTGLSSHDSEDYDRLVDDVRNHRLAGLFFVFLDPQSFVGTPVIDEPGIARVAYWKETEIPNLSSIQENSPAIVDRGLDYLVSRGRRRIGYLFGTGSYEFVGRYAETTARERGLICKPHWLQNPSYDPDLGGRCISLLMSGPPEDRPDGLICMSQNLTDSISAGLFAANVRVPEDVEVVTNCLFPAVGKSPIRLQLLGFHIRDYIETFLHLAREQEKGRFPSLTLIDPKFEEEYAQRASSPFSAHGLS